MKTVAVFSLFVLVSLTAASAHTDLTPAEVKAMLDAGGDIVVVDVREESEYCDSTYNPPGHIPDAVNMPWNSGYLQDRYDELPADHDIIVVCRSGNRSNSAANFLDGLGFTSVFDMLGGMNAWLWETEDCYLASIPAGGGGDSTGLLLGPATPNPFNVVTEIAFLIPGAGSVTDVSLRIYDSRGRLVTTIIDDRRQPGIGRAVWDGTDRQGRAVAGGVYFYNLAWNGGSRTQRLVLIR
jgi:rhodanese-related sulfurtransferase